ncbi:MAG: hypothetical protein CMA45_02195 [Euryarchaeota archaeon]|nr:hypothetical protein [Euryarchaeota archaeon]
MYDITIIGGSLSGLISAIKLSKFHKVCIIDINQEIGFPTNFPGFSKDITLIKEILSKEDISNLYLKENDIGWGMRSEWLVKYLTQLSAKNRVDILNRTRVSNIFFEGQFNIEIVGGGPQNNLITSKIIIDETKQIHSGPGEINHTTKIENNNIIKLDNSFSNYFAGIIPTEKSRNFSNSLLQIERDDGLTEVWFEKQPTEHINWIEIKNCRSPSKESPMLVDDYFICCDEIIKQVNQILT